MYHDAQIRQLDLLVPGELPTTKELSLCNQSKLKKALTELLQVLREPDIQLGIVRLENIIAQLDVYEVFTPEDTSTNTALKYWEVEDFDIYFQVRHVQTDELEICLVQGLLLTCQAFLYMSQGDNLLIDINQLELQREGFKNYAYLLGRVFQLNLES